MLVNNLKVLTTNDGLVTHFSLILFLVSLYSFIFHEDSAGNGGIGGGSSTTTSGQASEKQPGLAVIVFLNGESYNWGSGELSTLSLSNMYI